MSKLYEYLGLVIFFYSNEHYPVHVHARYQGQESKAEFIIVDGDIKEIRIKSVQGYPPLTFWSSMLKMLSKNGLTILFTIRKLSLKD
jgi:hypothetical protein